MCTDIRRAANLHSLESQYYMSEGQAGVNMARLSDGVAWYYYVALMYSLYFL